MTNQSRQQFPPRRLTAELQASIECPTCSIRLTIVLYESKPVPGKIMQSDIIDQVSATIRLQLDKNVSLPVRMAREIVTVIQQQLTKFIDTAQWVDSRNVTLIMDHVVDTICKVPHYQAYRLWLLNRLDTSQSSACWLMRKTRPLVVGPQFNLTFPMDLQPNQEKSSEELKLGEASEQRPRPHL